MSDKPQIFLLAPAATGLAGAFERLTDIGYQVLSLPTETKNLSGIGVLPLARNMDLNLMQEDLAQKRKDHPDMEWLAIYSGKLKVKHHVLHGLGFKHIYQIPLDEEIFSNRIFEVMPLLISQKDLTFDHLLRVNLPLLKEIKKAPFDVFMYLPSNRRIMLYFREGQPVEDSKLEKFEKNNYSLFIRKSDIRKYKEYSSKTLLTIKDSKDLSEAQVVERVQESMQVLMGPFFSDGELSDEEGRQTVLQVQEMLRGLQIQPNIEASTITSLEKLAAQKMTNASHSANVATYCALFGIALGMKNIDELRLGGLLHDVGLADLPIDLVGRDEKTMSDEDRARYHLHPGNGKTDVLNRKVQVGESVLNMILFHHERMDGSGYPYGKKKEEIPIEAQICAFADEFDKLTSLREGYRCYSAKDAMLFMSGQLGEPASAVFNPDVHQKVVDFYLKNGSVSGEASVETGVQGEVTVAPAANQSLGQVIQRAPSAKAERKKFAKPVLLTDLAKKMPTLPTGNLPMEAEIELEANALEKEIEFYFFDKKA